MEKNMHRALIFAVLAAGTSIAGTPALAQQIDESGDIGDILVTANRREQRLAEVPLSITAVTGDDLRMRQINNFQDLTAQVPGFVVQSLTPFQNRLIIRGQNSGSTGASVATVVDDVPFNFITSRGSSGLLAANVDTWDLERIEVLRGPQGTLYGAVAQGGLIKYVTKKPNPEKFEGQAEGSIYGVKDGEVQGSARVVVNTPLGQNAAFRLAASYEGIPGFIDNPLLNQTNYNGGEKIALRGSLLWNATDNMTFRVTVTHQTLRSDASNAVDVVGAARTPRVTPGNAFDPVAGYTADRYHPAESDNRFTIVAGEANFELGFGTLTSLTSYGKLETTFVGDVTVTNAAPGVTNGQAFSPLWGRPISIKQDQTEALEKFNQELRIASNPGKIEWQGGLFYSTEDTVFDQQYFPFNISDGQPAGLTVVPLNVNGVRQPAIIGGSIQPVSAETYAGFADVTLHLGSRFEVAAGARYTKTDQTSTSDLILGLLYSTPANPPSSSVSDSDWTYSFSAKWTPIDDTIIYGRIANGFRPGGPLFAIDPAPTFYSSDQTVNYEVGIRSSFLDGKVNAELTGYIIDWTDIQIITRFLASNGVTYTTTGNAGKAQSKGLEWALNIRPTTGLSVGFLGAYTDATLSTDAARLGGFAGDQLPYVPDWSYTLNVDYRVPLGEETEGYVGLSYNHVGTRFSDFSTGSVNSSHVRLPAYETVNMFAGVQFGNYGAQVYVRNLTNEFGVTSYNNSGGFNQTGTVTPIQPRTIGLVLSARF